MMKREERAKQFIPFDAMKGLKEALADREEKHSRVPRHEISQEEKESNSAVFIQLKKYTKVKIEYYFKFHDIVRTGRISEISLPFRYLKINDEKIMFEDIYNINILEF